MARAFARTDRGTQSKDRNSSMIAPFTRDRVGLELEPSGRIELLDRVDEAEDPVAHEIGLLDTLRGRPDATRPATNLTSGA